jgi:hypothetical protein
MGTNIISNNLPRLLESFAPKHPVYHDGKAASQLLQQYEGRHCPHLFDHDGGTTLFRIQEDLQHSWSIVVSSVSAKKNMM